MLCVDLNIIFTMALILLIEDELKIRENCKELLNNQGYDCITAADGYKGIELARLKMPDLIFCDISLPGIDGFAVKKSLNKNKDTAAIPVVYLTRKSERSDLKQALEIGAAYFISKPFKMKELYAAIERILANKKALEVFVNEKISDALSDFVHVARHECNTPLHGIINLSRLLKNNSDPESFKLIIDSIQASGTRLHKTLNNLIDMMRLTHYSDRYLQVVDYFDVGKVILETIPAFEKKYQLPINVQTDDADIWLANFVLEDIKLVINELTDNACKFSTQKKRVEILIQKSKPIGADLVCINFSNWHDSAMPCFTVEDIGPFKQFNREINEHQGSGLGLHLTKMICDKYHLKLAINSSADGHIIVSVTIPLQRNI